MNASQQLWLESLGQKITILTQRIAEGQYRASFILGNRRIGRKETRLWLVAEEFDPDSELDQGEEGIVRID